MGKRLFSIKMTEELQMNKSSKRMTEVCLSFMLGASFPTLAKAITEKVGDFYYSFFLTGIFLAMVVVTIWLFLRHETEHDGLFIYEIVFLSYFMLWLYGIAGVISGLTQNPNANHLKEGGVFLTGGLFLGYGLWGYLEYKLQFKQSWKYIFRHSLRVLSAIGLFAIYAMFKILALTHLFT